MGNRGIIRRFQVERKTLSDKITHMESKKHKKRMDAVYGIGVRDGWGFYRNAVRTGDWECPAPRFSEEDPLYEEWFRGWNDGSEDAHSDYFSFY